MISDVPRKVGIYCRISDDREGRGEGVDRQEAACKTLIKHKKWRLIDVYTDNDISATQTKKPRPSYLRLMEDLRSGRIDTVVVWAIDRLYRRPIELEDLLNLIEVQPDITVTAVQGSDLRLETSDGQVMARVMVALAKRETDLLKARIRSKHDDLANLGKPHGGARAFGYNKGQLTINQEEAEIVRKMVKMFLASQNSSEIVRWLHKNGVKTARGGEWRRKAVTDLLRNPRHAGYRSHKGTLTKAVWPAIVSEDDWREIKGILSDTGRRTQESSKSKYLLTRLVYCGNCGYQMGNMTRGKKLASTNTYACRSDPALLMRGCGSCRIFGAWVDDFVTTAVLTRLENDKKLIRNLHKPTKDPSEKEHNELVRALGQSRLKTQEATEMWADGHLSRAEFEQALRRLKEKQAIIERQLEKLEAARPVAMILTSTDLSKTWEERTLEEKRALIRLVIEKILIHKSKTPGRNTFDSSRIEILWRKEF